MTKTQNRIWIYASVGTLAVLIWINAPQPSSTDDVVHHTERVAPPKILQLQQEPASLDRVGLEATDRDPFAFLPVQVQSSKPVMPIRTEPPPPPPSPPALNLKYAGRMTAPDGKQLVFVMVGDNATELSVGQVLSNGYMIKAISEHAVDLNYPPMNFSVRFDLPAAPKYETR